MADIKDNNNSITENDINFHLKSNLNDRITNLENIIAQSEYYGKKFNLDLEFTFKKGSLDTLKTLDSNVWY